NYTSGNVETLPTDLAASENFTATVATESSETELWRSSLLLIVVLVLLAVEWTLRKRFGLA
ncbi:MAG: hypothetical protein BRD25_02655, partial [Bacteroidetes bacterium QH_1_61_8]